MFILSTLLKPVARIVSLPARRLQRSKPGSVLILVIALLVLLALIGTAYISTSRVERYTSRQNSANTQADLLLESVVNMTTNAIVQNIFGDVGNGVQARPVTPDGSSSPSGYNHYTYSITDSFLASRLPQARAIPINMNGLPVSTSWPNISFPLLPTPSGTYSLDLINVTGSNNTIDLGAPAKKGDYISYITSMNVNGLIMPAMAIFDRKTSTYLYPKNIPALAKPYVFPAADADGDGIADSPLWKLPVGQMDGVTYYAALRVIDNGSAVNASSAWDSNTDPGAPAGNALGFFRSNIDLVGMLGAGSVPTEINKLNVYRFNDVTGHAHPATVIGDNGARGDVNFYSEGDAIDNQLTRRFGFPGYNAPGNKYQWLGLSQSAALAYRFCLRNGSTSQSQIESSLQNELYTFTGAHTAPYSPTEAGGAAQAGTWYGDLFDFPATGVQGKPLRSILTCDNPVSNAVPTHIGNASSNPVPAWSNAGSYKFGDWVTFNTTVFPAPPKLVSYVCIRPHTLPQNPTAAASAPYWARVPWTTVPVKTSVNTANFSQLWLGFWDFMTDNVAPGVGVASPPMSSYGAPSHDPHETQVPMFRSVIRDPQPLITPPPARRLLTASQMLQLRAALAAVNTLDLRDADRDVTSKNIQLFDDTAATLTHQYNVQVYGTERNLYISEVIIQVDGTPANNFIAIELVNPYPDDLPFLNWQAVAFDRTNYSTGTPPIPTPLAADIHSLSATAVPKFVPGSSSSGGALNTLVLWDGAAPADILPILTSPPAHSQVIQIPGLAANIEKGRDIVIMRPRREDGTFSSSSDPDNSYNEVVAGVPAPLSMVPVDQVDTTGFPTVLAQTRYHYRRGSDPVLPARTAWNCVYPGPYDATQAGIRYHNTAGISSFITETGPFTTGHLGTPDGGAGDPTTYATVPLQLNNVDMAGFNGGSALTALGPNRFPFGGFARNGDMLQIPYIGAYCITDLTGALIEMNSVGMDASMAEDTDGPPDAAPLVPVPKQNPSTDAPAGAFAEQIGRFCPVGDPAGASGSVLMDFSPNNTDWRYHWTRRFFDYFTVQAPHDDYLPNVDPAPIDSTLFPAPTTPKYPGPAPDPIANVSSAPGAANTTTPGKSEDTVGVQGLININTAPWPVLASLPFLSKAEQGTYGVTNVQLAQAIVAYRDAAPPPATGPFTTIYDLYKVPLFRNTQNAILAKSPEPVAADGDFSGPDGVRFDFEERFLLMNRISNLITTRSDSFTCYVLLQGWRGVDTGFPTLAVQRRAAFIVDRTNITNVQTIPNIYRVPSN